MRLFRRSDEQKAAQQQRQAERGAELQAFAALRDDLKSYVREHKRERIASFADLHLFPDRIIRLPGFLSNSVANMLAQPEGHPIAGVQAEVDASGGVGGRATLARTMVPGAHGWQKKVDTRENWLMITGPSFQWALKVEPAMSTFARQFAAKVTSAGNAAAHRAPAPQPPAAASIADELRKLADLRAAGVLTPQEFDAAKARIVGR